MKLLLLCMLVAMATAWPTKRSHTKKNHEMLTKFIKRELLDDLGNGKRSLHELIGEHKDLNNVDDIAAHHAKRVLEDLSKRDDEPSYHHHRNKRSFNKRGKELLTALVQALRELKDEKDDEPQKRDHVTETCYTADGKSKSGGANRPAKCDPDADGCKKSPCKNGAMCNGKHGACDVPGFECGYNCVCGAHSGGDFKWGGNVCQNKCCMRISDCPKGSSCYGAKAKCGQDPDEATEAPDGSPYHLASCCEVDPPPKNAGYDLCSIYTREDFQESCFQLKQKRYLEETVGIQSHAVKRYYRFLADNGY